MKFLIVGLGNIGPEYELTRHNIGFLVLDQLTDLNKSSFSINRHAYVSEFSLRGKSIYCIKPTTFMNLSGKAVNHWMKELKIAQENILVITDDIALPYGKLRMRLKGSSGGHNGLKSIEETLSTQEFARLRFGVGDDFSKGRQADYVLSNFSKNEFTDLPLHIEKTVNGVIAFCNEGASIAMNRVNTN